MKWLYVTMLLFLCSCGTRKVIENVEVHDTITVMHTDTVVDIRIKTHADTVKEKEIHNYVVNNVGDTIKEVHHYHMAERVRVVDSTYRYKSELDSLRSVLNKEKEKEVVKTRDWRVPLIGVMIILFISIGVIYRK